MINCKRNRIWQSNINNGSDSLSYSNNKMYIACGHYLCRNVLRYISHLIRVQGLSEALKRSRPRSILRLSIAQTLGSYFIECIVDQSITFKSFKLCLDINSHTTRNDAVLVLGNYWQMDALLWYPASSYHYLRVDHGIYGLQHQTEMIPNLQNNTSCVTTLHQELLSTGIDVK